jgi:hypothetical protein
VATEPDFIHDLPVDNLVAAIDGLAAEVYLLRERLQSMEAELAAFVNRVLGEPSRDRKPVSRVDPAVSRYLDPGA